MVDIQRNWQIKQTVRVVRTFYVNYAAEFSTEVFSCVNKTLNDMA